MKKVLFFLISLILLSNCGSVEKFNAIIEKPLTVEQQMEDVNYLEKKIKLIQPSLYKFISAEQFKFKFDSLRNTIKEPLKPNEFYFKISPLLASIRQGHSSMGQLVKKYPKKEAKRINKLGLGPLSQFDFIWKDEKLYVLKNKSKDSSIVLGTEIVSIENIEPKTIFKKYRNTYTSDGFNETFIPYAFSRRINSYMFYELGLRDSLHYTFKNKDSIYTKMIKRLPKDEAKNDKSKEVKKDTLKDTQKSKDTVVLSKEMKKKASIAKKEKEKAERKKKWHYGYNYTTKEFSKELTFTDIDSCTAVLKIRDFSRGNFKKSYAAIFKTLKDTDTKNLVIDLRNNPGGRLNDIHNLYSYLTTDSTYQLIEKAKINSRMSMFRANYLKGMPKLAYLITIPTYPIYAVPMYLKTSKDKDGQYYFMMKSSKQKPRNENYFDGKIYVLINGGSFSASCIISSKLKENKNITFVGEETGGTFNGTVAGRISSVQLPNSKLNSTLWIMDIAATHKTENDGRGIFPDQTIIPTIEDIISKKDPEMEWIKNDIKTKNK